MLSFALIVICYIFIGSIAGIIGGVLGIGGGVITVPALFLVFKILGFPQSYLMHMAIGTSLAAMVFNTSAATWTHHKQGAVTWEIVKKMAPGCVVGSLCGGLLATLLSGIFLQLLFGVFLCALAIYFWRGKEEIHSRFKLPSSLKLGLISGGIGMISNLLGIGGGVVTVPFLSACKVKTKRAVGTSAAITLLLTSIGAVSYLLFGWGDSPGFGNIGFLNLPSFFAVGFSSFATAPFGARLTHKLPSNLVRQIFSIALVLTGLSMIFF